MPGFKKKGKKVMKKANGKKVMKKNKTKKNVAGRMRR